MTKEQELLIKIYEKLFHLRYLGTFENDDDLAFCPVHVYPTPQNITSIYYEDMLKEIEKNICFLTLSED